MYCSKCGNQIADNSAFCPYCGAQAQKPYVNPNQNGSITFYREKSWVAANSAAKIKIDGKTYCELNVNEHFTASLPYGSYNVEIKIALKPTETFFVTVSPENPNPYFSFKYDFSGKIVLNGDQNNNIVQTKNKKSNIISGLIFYLLLIFFLILLLCIIFKKPSSNSTEKTTKADNSGTSVSVEERKPVFYPVSGTIGNWEITVNDFSYVKNIFVSLLSEYRAEENSQYCKINLTVKNIGNEAATFLPLVSFGKTITVKIIWKEYEYTRSDLVFSSNNLSSETLNPLVSTSGDIVFELPNEVIESENPPVLVFYYGTEIRTCVLEKQ